VDGRRYGDGKLRLMMENEKKRRREKGGPGVQAFVLGAA
jgi:hypothetical protein